MSGGPVVVDTDVVSFLLRPNSPWNSAYRNLLAGRQTHVSFMTIAELYVWTEHRGTTATLRDELQRALGPFVLGEATDAVCLEWARIRLETRLVTGRSADAFVAATARTLGLPVMTHNKAHYEGLPGVAVETANEGKKRPPRKRRPRAGA